MKKAILNFLLFFTYSVIYAQSWSSHLLTPDIILPDPYSTKSIHKVNPDAVTSITGNPNSFFENNSIITAISVTEDGSIEFPDNSYEAGTWIIVKDPSGQTSLSKRIVNEEYHLSILSLEYHYTDASEMIVFTGFIGQNKEDEIDYYTIHRMVVGTYNLLTDQVKLIAVNQKLKNVRDEMFVASQGVGVRKLNNFSNTFVAIGQTGDVNNEDFAGYSMAVGTGAAALPNAAYPIGIVFSIDTYGNISILHSEIKDFLFKPHFLSQPLPILGDEGDEGESIIVSGYNIFDIYTIPNCTVPYTNNNPCNTSLGSALYTFDIINTGSSWQINVKDGAYLIHDEYAHHSLVTEPVMFVSVHDNYPESREAILGVPDITREPINPPGSPLNSGDKGLMFFKFNINTSDGSYQLVEESKFKLNNGDQVYARISKMSPNNEEHMFDVTFSLGDRYSVWNTPNRTSIGLMSLPVNGFSSTSHNFKSIYADDVSPNHITEINYVTGIMQREEGSHIATWLLADGFDQPSNSARIHFNYSSNNEFECENTGTAVPFNPNADPYYENFKPTKQKTIDMELLDFTAREVRYTKWSCDEYPGGIEGFRLKSTKNIQPKPTLIKGNNYYKIENLDHYIQQYKFYNMNGQEVRINLENNKFYTSHLKTGIYIINYTAGGNRYSEKVVIE